MRYVFTVIRMSSYHRKSAQDSKHPRNQNLAIRISERDRKIVEKTAALLNKSISAYLVDSALAISGMINENVKTPDIVKIGKFTKGL